MSIQTRKTAKTPTYLVDVREDTTTSNRCPDEEVELFVTTDGQLEVTRGDTLHAKVLGRVACEKDALALL